jgi:alanine-glyoxylate transaminase/serine-glyoxylate transaminase/serine-pyruvate transaminase
MSPIAVSGAARQRLVPCRSFYLDLKLLEDYWVGRKYHHTLSTTLIYALREALLMVKEEGLDARTARHERHHLAFAAGIEAMGLSLLPRPADRLWTLNAVRVPVGVQEADVRKTLLAKFNLEIGAGLGPLAGKIWRVGLMGASSTPQTILQFLGALEAALAANGHRVPPGAGVAAAESALRTQLTVA